MEAIEEVVLANSLIKIFWLANSHCKALLLESMSKLN